MDTSVVEVWHSDAVCWQPSVTRACARYSSSKCCVACCAGLHKATSACWRCGVGRQGGAHAMRASPRSMCYSSLCWQCSSRQGEIEQQGHGGMGALLLALHSCGYVSYIGSPAAQGGVHCTQCALKTCCLHDSARRWRVYSILRTARRCAG